MNKKYKNLIFTDHALHRTTLRSIRLEAIYQTVNNPNQSFNQEDNQEEAAIKFIKSINDRQHHVIAKKTDQGQWLVISVWIRGEEDPVPLMWQLLTFPFKVLWRLINKIIKKLI